MGVAQVEVGAGGVDVCAMTLTIMKRPSRVLWQTQVRPILRSLRTTSDRIWRPKREGRRGVRGIRGRVGEREGADRCGHSECAWCWEHRRVETGRMHGVPGGAAPIL